MSLISALRYDELLNILFDLFPQWEPVIIAQISEAKRSFFEDSRSNISVCFEPNRTVPPVRTPVQVPVEVILGKQILSNTESQKMLNGFPVMISDSLIVNDDHAVGVRFHFDKGYLTEIEVYSLIGSVLDNTIPINQDRVYLVCEELIE